MTAIDLPQPDPRIEPQRDDAYDRALDVAIALREAADHIERNPILAAHLNSIQILCWADDKPTLAALVTAVGPGEKNGTGDLIGIDRRFGAVELSVRAYKRDTCEQRVVGVRDVEVPVYPDGVEPTIEVRSEPVYEWVCPPSFLALIDQAEGNE